LERIGAELASGTGLPPLAGNEERLSLILKKCQAPLNEKTGDRKQESGGKSKVRSRSEEIVIG
jgi:hypothetical protein